MLLRHVFKHVHVYKQSQKSTLQDSKPYAVFFKTVLQYNNTTVSPYY